MGLEEADADGIEYYYDPNRAWRGAVGTYIFKVKCEGCGEIMETTSYGRRQNYICWKCRNKMKAHKKEVETAWFELIEAKGERRFNQACDRIQKQVKDFDKYEKAVRVARKAQDKYGSVPEAMVAIELIRIGEQIVPQQKIGKYRVDFYLPKRKAVIEVDGEMFHRGPGNGARDLYIQRAIGWGKIVHLPAELIAGDIKKLKKVIATTLEEP